MVDALGAHRAVLGHEAQQACAARADAMRLGAILVKRSLGGSLLPIVTELANTLALNEPCSFPDLIRGVPCPLAITVFGASRRHLPCPPMAKPSRVHFKTESPISVSTCRCIGSFAAWALQRWPGCHVHCYEPLPDTFALLKAESRSASTILPLAIRN